MIWPSDWRCVTQSQPWATLIARGGKSIITRADRPHQDDFPIGIVAGVHADWQRRVDESWRNRAIWNYLAAHHINRRDALPTAAVVAVAWMTSSLQASLCTGIGEWERRVGQYEPNMYAWMLINVCPVDEPIFIEPSAKLWTPETSLAQRLQTIYTAKQKDVHRG